MSITTPRNASRRAAKRASLAAQCLLAASSLLVFAAAFLALPPKAEAALPSTTGLTAYFPFDEGTASSTADSSGNGHAGSLNGNVQWTSGQIGGAVLFSSTTGQRVNTGTDYIGTGTTTVSGWVYPRSTGQSSAGRVIDNGQFHVRMSTTNRLLVTSNQGTTTIQTPNNAAPFNVWTHFAVVRGSTGLVTWYINGVATGTPNQNSGTPAATNASVHIGNRPISSATLAWDGYIDDVRVYSRDLSALEIADLYAATASYPDTLAPVLSAGSPSGVLSAGTTQTTLSLTTSEAATCKYGTVANTAYASIATTFSTTGGTSHSATLTGLVDGTSYTYYVRCQDATPNANSSDYAISFSVADEVDPVISNVEVESVRQTSATITWTTDENATSSVSYGATASYGSASTSDSYVTSHSVTLTGLTPNTTYHYRVGSADASNNISTSSDATFTTTDRDIWYVDASASGANDGTSAADAWTSLSAIVQSQLNANDVVLIYSGTYDERLTISKSGTSADARIIYKGYDDGGGMPVIRGINGGTHDYIAVIGLEIAQYVAGYAYAGITLSGGDGWLIEDNYIHHVYSGGVDLSYNTVNNNNIIRHNTFDRIGLLNNIKYGSLAVNVFGDANLVEYNTLGLAADFFRAFGTGNIIRNNYTTYTSELEFMDGISGEARRLATTTGGDWNASTGVWTKSGADVSAVRVNDVVRIYPDGGDSYSFASVVTATSTNTITVRITDYVGTLPTSGTGNRSAIVVAGQHIDCFQSFNSSRTLNKVLIERNWCEDNNSRNSHGIIIQDDAGSNGLGWLLDRGNVFLNLGATTHIYTGFTRAWSYNNTYYNPLSAISSLFNVVVSYSTADSANHSWINNSWNETGQNASQNMFSTSFHTDLYADYNHVSGGNTLNYGSNNLTATPLFTDASGDDYSLQSASPLRGAGRYATLADGSGSGSTSLVVDDPYPFSDGWGIAEGDYIQIGNGEYVQISSINYGTRTITLSAARSWSDNDEIIVKGMEDVGAIPYDYAGSFTVSLDNTTLPAGSVNLTATVSDTDAVRMVEYLVDDIPVGISYTSPYTVSYEADGESHEVTARAYNAWASQDLVETSTKTLGATSAPTITTSAASSLAQTSVTLNASISATGGANATSRGFAYGTSASLATVIATTSSSGSYSTGSFSESISSLTCNTSYYARAYATNPHGTGYGSIVTFTTSACATVSDDDSDDPAPSSSNVSGGNRSRRASGGVAGSNAATAPAAPVQSVSRFIDMLISLGVIPAEKIEAARAAAAKIAAAPAPAFTRSLQLHDTGSDVRSLQAFLIAKNLLPQGSDIGVFGPRTLEAVKAFQASVGLPETGYFGPLTRAWIAR